MKNEIGVLIDEIENQNLEIDYLQALKLISYYIEMFGYKKTKIDSDDQLIYYYEELKKI